MFDDGGFEAVVALFDSTITFHSQYQQRHDVPALVDLLVLDRDNPRSLAWVATLRSRLAKLEGVSRPGALSEVSQTVPDPQSLTLERPSATRDAEGTTPLIAPI